MSNNQTIIDYIKQLPQSSRELIYKSPIHILKIFDTDTKKLIFDLMLTALSVKGLQKKENLKNPLKILLKLQLITRKGQNIYLNETFRDSIISNMEKIKFYEPSEKVISMEEANIEDILKYLVNQENEQYENISKKKAKYTNSELIKSILLYSKLIDKNHDITNLGFEFLLKPMIEQYWVLIINSLKFFCKANEEINNFLTILELSNLETNKVYKLDIEVNDDLFNFLRIIGLIGYSKDMKVEISISKTFKDIFKDSESSKSKFLILETNFKLYAHTTSVYMISIISLFSEINMKLPNLVKGSINEDGLNKAFSKGITGFQIINFLNTYNLVDEIPASIINQIHIWESKRKRIKVTPGYLYSNFLNLVDYQKLIKFCKSKDYLVDCDDEKRMLIIKEDANDAVKEYFKKINKS